jgi:hypothetical protein
MTIAATSPVEETIGTRTETTPADEDTTGTVGDVKFREPR